MIHSCTRCELRFRTDAEVREHLRLDHDLDTSLIEAYPAAQQRPLYTEPEDAHAIRCVLVVANQTLRSPQLMSAISERAAQGPCHVVAAVPATHSAHLVDRGAFVGPADVGVHASDDAGTAQASWRLRAFLDGLRARGISAEGDLGPADPYEAAGSVLEHRRVDEIIVSTLPPGLSRWFSSDVAQRLRRRFGTDVTVITAAAPAPLQTS